MIQSLEDLFLRTSAINSSSAPGFCASRAFSSESMITVGAPVRRSVSIPNKGSEIPLSD
ncbi:hypothetical protein D3C71_1264570 [compost metagenome]